ncbi:hypothetical protein Kpol_1036p59 [Vanderwaltozyma polyspora DSM 70294]|uniref:Cleavage and polyadenylation specificity factor subunit 2 n=1 Tax=Vanderwaltozyma polyspora (strain ATCC 22028 / DSM 70294 / BCRC 21397 / CBS 2163 / NBRC 10782 / NRRL Y-8283 / UCD 57-17) TaxID=436907 RepID=A7TEK7_VANPO|nr:uncharacterized protein Kpol_1036p59 [Vanderwaltozyma polyspora DSM 70294]EDO19314.1 hypothetical protein Kpol_1036p59 [Vanderwaltozyma polyspora DSM 70294]
MTYTFRCCDDGSGYTVGTIVRFDNVTILIDPSWNGKNVSYADSIKYWSTIIPEVDIILLSQPSLECLGAYSMLYYNFVSHFVSRIDVYATLPVSNLGRISVIEQYACAGIIGPYETNEMDLEDIEKSFDNIKTVKYSQLVDLRSKFDGLTLVAYNSGVNAGGSIWCLLTYSEKLVYAPHWNHTKDTILNGAALLDNTGKPLSTLMKPTAIITSLGRFGSALSFRKRSKNFNDSLKRGLSNNGSIMIPVDITGKFLDLFVQVHNFLYENSKSGSYNQTHVLLIAYFRGKVLTYARSMLEWLSSSLMKTWESRDNASPFDIGSKFKVIDPSEISNFPGSKVCFVSQVDILLNEVLTKLCSMNKTTVLMTSTNTNNTQILETMYEKWEKAKTLQKLQDGSTISFTDTVLLKIASYKPLVNEQLEEYNARLKERRDKCKETVEILKKEAKLGTRIGDMYRSEGVGLIHSLNDEEDEDEDEEEENILNSTSSQTKSFTVPVDIKINRSATSKHKMFPFQPGRTKIDDYGSVVDFNMFIPEELNTEIDTNKRPSSRTNEMDDDPYDLGDAQKITKRSRRGDRSKSQNENAVSIDNIQYLEADNNPTIRTISENRSHINCTFTFMNLDSLVDTRSATVIWPSFKPRKILLLAEKVPQNTHIISTLQKKDIEIVEMPSNVEQQFTTTIKALDISIDPELDQMLRWQKIGYGHTVAHVIGRLVKEKVQNSKLQDDDKEPLRTKMVLKPMENRTKVHTGISLSIGDIRLAEVKRKLTDQKHIAEFKGEGTLVVDGQVSIRKINDGETIIDGSPSELYDIVKKAVVEMLAKI